MNGLDIEKKSSDRISKTIDFLTENAEKNGDKALKEELIALKQGGFIDKAERLADIARKAGLRILFDAEDKSQPKYLYSVVAQALSEDYSSIYYVDIHTDNYVEYSSDAHYKSLKVERKGEDFFADVKANVPRIVYEDDRDKVTEMLDKTKLIAELEVAGKVVFTYRLLFDGNPVYFSCKVIPVVYDGQEKLVVGISNVDAQVRRRLDYERERERNFTYSRIAYALSQDYFSIYYVDMETGEYVEYSADSRYRNLKTERRGQDFFGEGVRHIQETVYEPDKLKVSLAVEKHNVLTAIEREKYFSVSYRLMINGAPKFCNLKAIKPEEKYGSHLIIGIRNIDAQIKQEQSYRSALDDAQALANRDFLTGVRNKRAYSEKEAELNAAISRGENPRFAIAVCDVNGLKNVNDSLGHQAGDELIKEVCAIVCETFKHSAVFRVGGDEFVAVLEGKDYEKRNALVEELYARRKNNARFDGIIVACGVAERTEKDKTVAAVFDRADVAMYSDKRNCQ